MTARKSVSIKPLSCDTFFSEMPSCSNNSCPSSSFMEQMTDSVKNNSCAALKDNNEQVTQTVVPHKSLAILESIKQPVKLRLSHFITTMAEIKTVKRNNIARPVMRRSLRSLWEESSSSEEIISNNRVNSSSTRKRVSTEPYTKTPSIKRISTISVNQEKVNKKRISKRNERKSLKNYLDNCDKKVALEMLLTDEEIDANEIIQRYYEKKKLSDWDKKDVQKQVSEMYDIDLKNGNANSAPQVSSSQKIEVRNQGKTCKQLLETCSKKDLLENDTKSAVQMSPMQEVVVSLHKCFGDNFVDTMLETFAAQFKAAKVLEALKSDELESAILHKFTADQLLNLFHRSITVNHKNQNNQRILEQILELASPEMIVNHIQSTDNLKNSELLLDVLLENFSQAVPEDLNEDLKNSDNKSDSKNKLINGVVNLVKSKNDLKTSECLLNVLLEHGPKVVSDETKKNIKRFLMKKFSPCELNKLSHEVTSSFLTQRIIQID